jgi:hypothetical protein
MHTSREVCRGYLMPCCPSPAPGLGRFWAQNLCGWLIRGQVKRGFWEQRSLKVQGSNNWFWLSAPEPVIYRNSCPSPAEDNKTLFLIETFIILSRIHEVSI